VAFTQIGDTLQYTLSDTGPEPHTQRMKTHKLDLT